MTTPTQPDPKDEPLPVAAPRRQKKVSAPPPPPRRDSTAVALGIVALVLGLLALVVAVLDASGVIGRSGGTAGGGVPTGTCQRTAWASMPKTDEVPDGWTIQAPDYEVSRVSATLLGQTAADGTQTQVYMRVTCFGDDASEAIQRSKVSNIEAGVTVGVLKTGDEGFTFDDSFSSSFGAYFREGNLVAYLLLQSGIAQSELDTAVATVDKAMLRAQGPGGLDIPAAVPPSEGPASSADASLDPNATPGPSEAVATPAAPELEALLPAKVDAYTLTKSSFTGADLFEGSDSTVGRAITAALAKEGKKPTDLLMAQATEDTGQLDLQDLSAFTVKGVPIAKVAPIILQSFFNSGISGVTTTDATIGGKNVKVIDFGDAGAKSYAYVSGDSLIVISTADDTIAASILSGLK